MFFYAYPISTTWNNGTDNDHNIYLYWQSIMESFYNCQEKSKIDELNHIML
jgi:hypothetical protein